MKAVKSIFFAIIAICCLFQSQTYASGDTVCAFGSAYINKNNFADAKNSAVKNAINNAMQIYLVDLIGEKDIALKFADIIEKVLIEKDKAILNYNILSEHKVKSTYHVFIKTKLNVSVINDLLKTEGFFSKNIISLNILLMITEGSPTGGYSKWWMDKSGGAVSLGPAELSLIKELTAKGFLIVDRTQNLFDISKLALSDADLTYSRAVAFGKQYGADVVLFGINELTQNGMVTMKVTAADVNKKVIIENTFVEQALKAGTPSGQTGMQPVIDYLAKMTVESLFQSIISSAGIVAGTQKLAVRLDEIDSYRDFSLFKTFLMNKVSGVTDVKEQSSRKGSISMEVDYEGKPDSFVQKVMGNVSLPFDIEVKNLSSGGIIFGIINKGKILP